MVVGRLAEDAAGTNISGPSDFKWPLMWSTSMSAERPTRIEAMPYSRAAATAPSTLTAGAWSPPMASTAMRI